MTKDHVDVMFYTRQLHNGGVDRVVFNLAEEFRDRGMTVSLVVDLDNIWSPFRGLLPTGVQYEVLDARGPLSRLLKLRRYLREKRPRALMCASFGFPNIYAIVARWISGIRFHLMLTEHCFPSVDFAMPKPWQSRYWFFRLAPLFYPLADSIVAVSQGTANDLARVIRISPQTISCIYNPIVNSSLLSQSREQVDHPWFNDPDIPVVIAVGRLEPQKNFALLLRAFAQLRAAQVCRLVILGDGSERVMLESLAKSLKIDGSVSLPGFASNPHAYVAKASVFVLSSNFESLANVVVEAMAVGTPVIATDCPSGPAEALRGGDFGTLVPVGDVTRLSNAMKAALGAERQPAAQSWLDQFTTSYSANRYLELLLPAAT